MKNSLVTQYLHSDATRGQEMLAVLFVCVSTITLFVGRAAALEDISAAIASFLLVVSLILWISVCSLVFLFQERRLALYSFGVVSVVALLFFFRSLSSLAGVLFLAIGLFDAMRRAQDEKKLILEFRPYRIMRRALPVLLLAVSLFSAIGYVTLVLADDFEGDVHIPRALFNVMFAPVDASLGALVPGYHEGLSVSGTQSAIARDIFRPEALERFGVNNVFETIEESEGENVPLKEAVYTSLNNSIASAAAPYREALPFVAIVGFFFVFRLFFFLLMWLSIGASMLAVKLLRLYNVVSINTEAVKQEQAQIV